MEKDKPCTIHWVDIATPPAYWSEEEEGEVEKCISRGYFVKESESTITIAQSITEKANDEYGHHYGGLLTIPRGAVVKIECDSLDLPKNIDDKTKRRPPSL